ncbi:hypothetical protein MGN70_001068 [Eutypa lata]|nr:hypothetical protein MGN70_001068 [Eutypa lata]
MDNPNGSRGGRKRPRSPDEASEQPTRRPPAGNPGLSLPPPPLPPPPPPPAPQPSRTPQQTVSDALRTISPYLCSGTFSVPYMLPQVSIVCGPIPQATMPPFPSTPENPPTSPFLYPPPSNPPMSTSPWPIQPIAQASPWVPNGDGYEVNSNGGQFMPLPQGTPPNDRVFTPLPQGIPPNDGIFMPLPQGIPPNDRMFMPLPQGIPPNDRMFTPLPQGIPPNDRMFTPLPQGIPPNDGMFMPLPLGMPPNDGMFMSNAQGMVPNEGMFMFGAQGMEPNNEHFMLPPQHIPQNINPEMLSTSASFNLPHRPVFPEQPDAPPPPLPLPQPVTEHPHEGMEHSDEGIEHSDEIKHSCEDKKIVPGVVFDCCWIELKGLVDECARDVGMSRRGLLLRAPVQGGIMNPHVHVGCPRRVAKDAIKYIAQIFECEFQHILERLITNG